MNAWIEAGLAMKSLDIISLLASLETLKRDISSIDEASRIIGHLVAIQEKYVGCVSLSDLLTAREACDDLLETGRLGGGVKCPGLRKRHGIDVATELGWAMSDGSGGYEMTCMFYDPRSVVAVTRKQSPIGARFGVQWLKGQLNAANHFNITAERECLRQAG